VQQQKPYYPGLLHPTWNEASTANHDGKKGGGFVNLPRQPCGGGVPKPFLQDDAVSKA